MIGRKQKSAALAVMLAAHNRYGAKSFVVDVCGPNYRPLKDAEAQGWVWFNGERCAILDAGVRQLDPYRNAEPRPIVQWICPICLCTVGQEGDAEGLPMKPQCPHCREATLQAAERFRSDQAAS